MAMEIEAISREVSLYRIETALVDLVEAREAAEDEETKHACEVALQEYLCAEIAKCDGIVAYIRDREARSTMALAEAERMRRIAVRLTNEAQRVKDATLWAMQVMDRPRIEGRLGTLKVVKNPPKVEIYNDELVALEFKTATITMPAQLWLDLCSWLSSHPTAWATMEEVTQVVGSADSFTSRKADIAKALKEREGTCLRCVGWKDLPGGETCDECGGTGKQAGHVAGARLKQSERLEIK